jgi:hypothetical protein
MAVKLIIAGSRTVYPSVDQIDIEVLKLPIWEGITPDIARLKEVVSHVVSGRSPGGGADEAGELWAEARGIEVIPIPITDEDWEKHGRYLGPKMRNRRVADVGDIALIWWDCSSGGSADLSIRLQVRGKPQVVVPMKANRQPTRGKRRRQA